MLSSSLYRDAQNQRSGSRNIWTTLMNNFKKFEVNPMSSLSGNVQQVLRQSQEDGNSTKYDQPNHNQIWGSPNHNSNKFVQKCMVSVWPIKGQDRMEIQWSVTKSQSGLWNTNEYFHQVYPETHRKYRIYQRPWNHRNSVKCDQKFIRSEDLINKNFYQVWGQYHGQYVQKCTETKCMNDRTSI